jgi:hypothetical protein
LLIFNQFANHGKGPTIVSCLQLEAYGVFVDDKSSRAGGTQRIITIDGYVIPVDIINGLPYMPLHPPTDDEMQGGLPQIHMTSNAEEWVPSALDSIVSNDQEWFDAIPDNQMYPDPKVVDLQGTFVYDIRGLVFHDAVSDPWISSITTPPRMTSTMPSLFTLICVSSNPSTSRAMRGK